MSKNRSFSGVKEFAVVSQNTTFRQLPDYTDIAQALKEYVALSRNDDPLLVQRARISVPKELDLNNQIVFNEERFNFPRLTYEGVVVFAKASNGYKAVVFPNYTEAFKSHPGIVGVGEELTLARSVKVNGIKIRTLEERSGK